MFSARTLTDKLVYFVISITTYILLVFKYFSSFVFYFSYSISC